MIASSRVLLAAVFVGGLLLTGCSTGERSPGGEEPGGPLDPYRMAAYGLDFNEETYFARQAASEEVIASCMRDEGFEYTPQGLERSPGQTFSGDEESLDSEPQWGTVEFAQRYGYGIVESPWEQWSSDGSDQDPNSALLDALSESERAAYFEALHGPESIWAEPEAGDELQQSPPMEEQGCWGQGQLAVQTPQQEITAKPEYEALISGMDSIWQRIDESPKMHELNKQWAACMDQGGYPGHTSIDEASSELQTQYHDLMVWPEGDAMDSPPQEPDAAQKKTFLAKEIAAATVDFECQEKLKVSSKRDALHREGEQQFLEAHKAELDAMLAELNRVAPQKKQGE